MKGGGKRRWVRIVALVLVVLIVLGVGGYGLLWAGLSRWPGSYTYTESRIFDSVKEGAALREAELFDYSVFLVGDNETLAPYSYYRGMVEYSVLPLSELPFLANATLAQYRLINHTFNPFLILGKRTITYIANSTYFPSLNVTLNATALGSNQMSPLVFANPNGTIAETWTSGAWRGGYWNGTDYVSFEYVRNRGFVGPQFLLQNHTDVYFIDMLFTILRDGAGSRSFFGDMFRYIQRVIVDATGRVLFVSSAQDYLAWI